MVPSLEQVLLATVRGLNRAAARADFSGKMLMSGKTKGNVGRERLLCAEIARTLESDGFVVGLESHHKIDISIHDATTRKLLCAIEAKFLFCHHSYQSGTGHQYFVNIWKDFEKREHLGIPFLEIVFAAHYESMRSDGANSRLYQARGIWKHLSKHAAAIAPLSGLHCCSFTRFESDLHQEFGTKWQIAPRRGHYPVENVWRVEHEGAVASIRAWVLAAAHSK